MEFKKGYNRFSNWYRQTGDTTQLCWLISTHAVVSTNRWTGGEQVLHVLQDVKELEAALNNILKLLYSQY